MITLEHAIKLVETAIGKVDSILDCGDRWAFDFYDEKDKLGAVSIFVFKENGKFEYFSCLMEECQKILKSGKLVFLSEGSTA